MKQEAIEKKVKDLGQQLNILEKYDEWGALTQKRHRKDEQRRIGALANLDCVRLD